MTRQGGNARKDPLGSFLKLPDVAAIDPANAMSELERVQHLIAVVNVPLLTAELVRRLVMGGGAAPDGAVIGTLSESFRGQLTEWLDQIVRDRRSASLELRPQIAEAMRELVLLPFVDNCRPGIKTRLVGVSRTPRAALMYAVALLLDDDLNLGVRLKRCRLASCGQFFFQEKPKRGQAAFRYCSRRHQQESDQLKGAERVRKYRARHPAKRSRRSK